MELLKYIFSSDDTFIGTIVLLLVVGYVIRSVIATASRAQARVALAKLGKPEVLLDDDDDDETEIAEILQSQEGGILKMIDQNREVIQHVEKFYPEVISNEPRVLVLLRSLDTFLCALADCDDAYDEDECDVTSADFAEQWPRPRPQSIS